MADHRARHRAGTPIGGRFAPSRRAEPAFTLEARGGAADAALRAELLPGGRRMLAQHTPGMDPLLAGSAEEMKRSENDEFVASIMERSALTNGVIGQPQRQNFQAWKRWADDRGYAGSEEHARFAAGMDAALLALSTSRMADQNDVGRQLAGWVGGPDGRSSPNTVAVADPDTVEQVLEAMGQARTTADSRKRWLDYAQLAPTTADQRGYFTAAAVLAGLDDAWGLRDDLEATVHGLPSEAR